MVFQCHLNKSSIVPQAERDDTTFYKLIMFSFALECPRIVH